MTSRFGLKLQISHYVIYTQSKGGIVFEIG